MLLIKPDPWVNLGRVVNTSAGHHRPPSHLLPYSYSTTKKLTIMSFFFGRGRARPYVDLPKQAREGIARLEGASNPAKVPFPSPQLHSPTAKALT